VVSEREASASQSHERLEEGPQATRVIAVGRLAADASVHLREAGTAKPVASGAKIHQHEPRVAEIRAKLRRQRAPHVLHWRKSRDDQRHRCDDLAQVGTLVPRRLHGKRVLADRDRDTERRAELLADCAHGVVEVGVLARLATGGHPVGGESHVLEARDVRRRDVGH